jgi:hypothetical protein
MHKFTMITVCLCVLSAAACGVAQPAEAASFHNLTGPTRVQPGIAYTYVVEVNGSFADAGWAISGGSVLQQWWEGAHFFCQAQWVESAPDATAALEVWGQEQNGRIRSERLVVSPPRTPPETPGTLQNLNGPTSIRRGQIYTYAVTADGAFADVSWEATGGTILQHWHEGSQYFCRVQWHENLFARTGRIKAVGTHKDGNIVVQRLSVSPQSGATPQPFGESKTFGKLTGPAAVRLGQTYTYSVTVEGEFAEIGWNAAGGNVLDQWWEAPHVFCQVQWNESRPDTPTMLEVWGKDRRGRITVAQLMIAPQATPTPSAPEIPGALKNLNGPTPVQPGERYTYAVTAEGALTDITWEARDGEILRQWQKDAQYFCEARWHGIADNGRIKVSGKQTDGAIVSEGLTIALRTPARLPGTFSDVTGPSVIRFGEIYTYSATVAGEFAEIGWSATGGKVVKQWQQGINCSARCNGSATT